ncbi:unnamed protein product, partial [marine sediment metagenome]
MEQASVYRYKSYLRHLLIWADDTYLGNAQKIKPAFTAYIDKMQKADGKGSLANTSKKKIIGCAKRLFNWAKMNYPRKFKEISNAWIDTLKPPRNVH